MARLTVEQIMVQIASTVNQEASAPTEGGAEWDLWLAYINRAVEEWSNANDWEVMRKAYWPTITGISQASVLMPSDFKKLAAAPILWNGDKQFGTEYPEVLPEQRGLYNDEVDKYVTIRGDISNGFSIIMNPPTLASGASLSVQYFSMPTSLTSNAQVPLTTNSQFLIDRTIAYIFEARSDPRFQLEEQKARERLLTMVEDANLSKFNSYANPNFVVTPERKQGFRIGRDG
jgi:hypothetical protein